MLKSDLAERITSVELTQEMAREKVYGSESFWLNLLLRFSLIASNGGKIEFAALVPEPMRWRLPAPPPRDLQAEFDRI